MKTLRCTLDKCLEIVCSLILVMMIVIVLYQIFTRVVLNNPNTITEELVRFCLVWLSMLASAYVVGKNSHLAVTLLSELLKGKNKGILEVVIQILFMLFAVIIMLFGGWKGVSVTMGQISPSLTIPMGYVYLAVPVSGVLILVYNFINLLDLVKADASEESGVE